jgi:hypothetical protein
MSSPKVMKTRDRSNGRGEYFLPCHKGSGAPSFVAGQEIGFSTSRGEEPQVPPLRFAPVGMTISGGGNASRWSFCGHNRIVIPTGAKRSGGTCGSSPRVLTPS